ncbi:hemolysin [Brevundimonas sp.]|uniref:hemolysin n=1 Tax=Brevundimonas sp. TaxID=1871086 RepID=UPI002D6C60E5|nr:hemolysin [Brevundimonas sp.]HYC68067.1 hemolysin [Brevundimonas sp.]
MRPLILLAGAIALTSCAPVAETSVQPGPQRCDAEAARSLIGTHVGAVSFPAGANVRVVCTTCPTTKDLRPDRLNVRFDEATGIIRSVDCG